MCRLHCRIKESCGGVNGSGMPPMHFEEEIWPDGGGVPNHTAADEVVADTKMARETFAAMFGDMKNTAALTKQFLTSKATLLHQLDKNWKIEDWGATCKDHDLPDCIMLDIIMVTLCVCGGGVHEST